MGFLMFLFFTLLYLIIGALIAGYVEKCNGRVQWEDDNSSRRWLITMLWPIVGVAYLLSILIDKVSTKGK